MLAGHESLKKLRFNFWVSAISSVVTLHALCPYIDSKSLGSQKSSQHCNNTWIKLVGLSRL